jgi:hypothetical protein
MLVAIWRSFSQWARRGDRVMASDTVIPTGAERGVVAWKGLPAATSTALTLDQAILPAAPPRG